MITTYRPTKRTKLLSDVAGTTDDKSFYISTIFREYGMNIKDKNYITIQGWMRTELDLKGNDLIVYALIYGFCQSENQKFSGSLQYIADWCGATKQGVMKNLQNLISKNLIVKESNWLHGVNIVEYYTTEFNGAIKHSLINNNSIDNIEKNTIIINNNSTENDFLGQLKKTTKRKSMYDKCYDHILEFTTNVGLIDALTEYLKIRLQMKDKPLYEGTWKGMLKKLANMDNQIDVVNTSIERGWASFFEPKSSKGKERFGEDDNVKSVKGEFDSSGETF